MNYDDLYLLSLIKKLHERMSLVESSVANVSQGIETLIIRDSPTLPTEPPPPVLDRVWLLTFRNGAPGLIWDPSTGWLQ